MNERVYSLDTLRGVMALVVMIYHYNSWLYDGLDSSNILSRFGIYAVTIFYFISGFSMMYGYWEKNKFYLKGYIIRRFFRIAPLFYMMSLIFISYQLLTEGHIDIYKAFLNFTFLFSLIDPSAYYSTGAWSIGNEMFFYCVFALILYLRKSFKILISITLISLLAFILFRTYFIDTNKALSSQWYIYISPLNHIFTFLVGCLSYFIFKNYMGLLLKYKFLLIPFSFVIFLMPIYGDRVNLVKGFDGLLLLISCYTIFLLFLSLKQSEVFNNKIAIYLGDISYSIYLVHPACWFVIKKFFPRPFGFLDSIIFWFFCVFFTLLVCSLTYFFVEKPGINFGKKILAYKRDKS